MDQDHHWVARSSDSATLWLATVRTDSVYMQNNGKLTFGVYPDSQDRDLRSSYNDGPYHHVVAQLGGGISVRRRAALKRSIGLRQSRLLAGWRQHGSWTGQPRHLTGTIDDVRSAALIIHRRSAPGREWARCSAAECTCGIDVASRLAAMPPSTDSDGTFFLWDFGGDCRAREVTPPILWRRVPTQSSSR